MEHYYIPRPLHRVLVSRWEMLGDGARSRDMVPGLKQLPSGMRYALAQALAPLGGKRSRHSRVFLGAVWKRSWGENL